MELYAPSKSKPHRQLERLTDRMVKALLLYTMTLVHILEQGYNQGQVCRLELTSAHSQDKLEFLGIEHQQHIQSIHQQCM
uniref:Uncharacterized protein n=1 Tax=Lepeophtheirus salmonis TaxID=72036 RepID=A0A0K2U7Q9_LEPSM